MSEIVWELIDNAQKVDKNVELKLLKVYQTTLYSKEYNFTGPVGRQDDLIFLILYLYHITVQPRFSAICPIVLEASTKLS